MLFLIKLYFMDMWYTLSDRYKKYVYKDALMKYIQCPSSMGDKIYKYIHLMLLKERDGSATKEEMQVLYKVMTKYSTLAENGLKVRTPNVDCTKCTQYKHISTNKLLDYYRYHYNAKWSLVDPDVRVLRTIVNRVLVVPELRLIGKDLFIPVIDNKTHIVILRLDKLDGIRFRRGSTGPILDSGSIGIQTGQKMEFFFEDGPVVSFRGTLVEILGSALYMDRCSMTMATSYKEAGIPHKEFLSLLPHTLELPNDIKIALPKE